MNITIYTKSNQEINLMDVSDGSVKTFEDWFSDDLESSVFTANTSTRTKVGINRNEISYYKVWYS